MWNIYFFAMATLSEASTVKMTWKRVDVGRRKREDRSYDRSVWEWNRGWKWTRSHRRSPEVWPRPRSPSKRWQIRSSKNHRNLLLKRINSLTNKFTLDEKHLQCISFRCQNASIANRCVEQEICYNAMLLNIIPTNGIHSHAHYVQTRIHLRYNCVFKSRWILYPISRTSFLRLNTSTIVTIVCLLIDLMRTIRPCS